MTLGRNWERIELPGRRTQLFVYQKPIAYLQNGIYVPITNVLTLGGSAPFVVHVDELLQFDVRAKLTGNAPVLKFGKGQTHVHMTPLNTNNVDGVVNGQSITFPEAWPNADLKLIVAGHRVQKDIILRTGHPQTFQFRIDAHQGLDVEMLSTPDFRILQPVLRSPNGLADVPLAWDVSQSGGKYILTVTLPRGDFAGWVLDPTLTLQPDATDGLDCYIYDSSPATNTSVQVVLAAGERSTGAMILRSLIKFNLSALPDGAIISSAVLSLTITAENSDNVRTCRVYRQKRTWVETQATWNNYSSGNSWQTAGGFGADDCEQTDIGSASFSASETAGTVKDFSLTPITKAGLDLGNGWLLKMDTETNDENDFRSSNGVTAGDRPKLGVVYTLGGFPGTGMLRGLVGG